jgi:ABC-type glycerol-3-phosphate transport system substrate-binding protein
MSARGSRVARHPAAGAESPATTRRVALRVGAAAVPVALAGGLAACGAPREAGAPAGAAPPASLLMVTDRAGPDLDAQAALFARFTQEQPRVTFEFSPNPPGQAARDRVKIMAQGGAPPDFWETTRAAFGDMLLAGLVAPLSDYIRRDKLPFERLFVPDHVDHVTVQGKVYGWPIVISADALAYNQELFDARGLPHPPTNPEDASWTMERFLDVAQKLTRGDGQHFGFGGTRSGFARLTDGTNWGQPPWDGRARCLFDTALWQQAEQFWTECLFKWRVQPTAEERPPLAPPSGPFFFNGRTGMDVVFGKPPANLGFRWGLATLPFTGKGKNVAGRLGLHSLHMGQGGHKDTVWQVFSWFRRKEHAGAYPMTWGSPVSPLLDGGSDAAQAAYRRSYNVDPKAFLQTALAAKRSGWGLQSLVKFPDYDPQIEKLYNDLFANALSVGDYVRQATPIMNRMIEESQQILPITGSKA